MGGKGKVVPVILLLLLSFIFSLSLSYPSCVIVIVFVGDIILGGYLVMENIGWQEKLVFFSFSIHVFSFLGRRGREGHTYKG